MPFNYIDLFAGAGGLSEGFVRNGFNAIAHVEIDSYAAHTLKTRAAYYYLKEINQLKIYKRYITGNINRDEFYAHIPEAILSTVINEGISTETVGRIFKTINNRMAENQNVDLIIGGPPCQAYSLVGRARDPKGMQEDPRNHLYQLYIEFLKRYKPTIFVFENVEGILSARKGSLFTDIKNAMEDAGYKIEARLLHASDYGVLQNRKRIILIGWRKKHKLQYPEFEKTDISGYKVQQLLSDLPTMEPGDIIQCGDYGGEATEYLKNSGIRKQDDILLQHISRPHNERDREIYEIAIDLWDRENKRLVYTDLPERLRTHNNLKSFLDRFKVVPGNLPSSQTVVAHISKDGHYYIHPDINQKRSLTVREAARIQSFPDDFFFEGPRTSIFTQIGNAVPPIMAEHIARGIKEMLERI